MKILIATLGSRGDVQPYLALAVGLQQAGHGVTLAAPQTFAGWIQSYGVDVAPVQFNPQDAMQKLSQTGGGLRSLSAMLKIVREGMKEAQADVWQAAKDTDFFIQSATGMGAMEMAELRGIPAAFAYLFPFAPTRSFPMFWLPFRFSLGGGYNLLTHKLMARLLWRFGGSLNNQWRGRLGLKPWRSEREMFAYARALKTPFLYGYSPSLLPAPADWDEQQQVTGYWFLSAAADWQPPAALRQFLADGSPPVYVGFGSMRLKNAERQTQAVLEALALSGQRAVLSAGWGGLEQGSAPANLFFVEDVPHDWLFARVTAVVHHGGAGTTSAGLRAGIPSIIAPFGGDQWSWADLVVKAGVGLRVGSGQRIRAKQLAAAMETVITDPTLRQRANAFGDAIRAENGIARAIQLIENHAHIQEMR
jgi:UDP:flavonoid glycosyltransferase YjiC (YdhE family)